MFGLPMELMVPHGFFHGSDDGGILYDLNTNLYILGKVPILFRKGDFSADIAVNFIKQNTGF